MAGALSLPCHQGDVEYAFEQLDSGSFVASVSVAALERPIAGYPELKKAGRLGKIGEDRGRSGWPGGQQLEQQKALGKAVAACVTIPDGSCVTEGLWLTRAIQNRPLKEVATSFTYIEDYGILWHKFPVGRNGPQVGTTD